MDPNPCRAICVFLLLFPAIIEIPSFSHAQSEQKRSAGPEFRYGVKVELVNVFATVRDRTGKLVTDLNKEDFVVYDKGIVQAVTQFRREYYPLSILILLDTSFSMSGKKLGYAKKSLDQFLKRLKPTDEAMLMTFRNAPTVVQPFTVDLGSIKKSLRMLSGSGSTALYDAILAALNRTSESKNRRRALLLISDGINTYGKAELCDTIEQLRRRGVELFAIGLESDLPGDLHSGETTRKILDRLTQSAGGEAFIVRHTKRLGEICDIISDRLHSQYTFGYYPPRTVDGQWRSIEIDIKIPGYKVVASKTGYYPVAHNP